MARVNVSEHEDGETPELNDVLGPESVVYSSAVEFARGRRLRFPDFDIQYLGQEVDPATHYRHWRFRVSSGDSAQVVVLESGGVLSEGVTFDINEHRFSVAWVRGAQHGDLRRIVVQPTV
jgi:hypothetical protein